MRHLAALALLIAVCCTPSLAQEEVQATATTWGRLPSDLARSLELKAEGYHRRALGFTCVERRREARYGSDRETSKERFRDFEYLLTEAEGEPFALAAVRTRPGAEGKGEKKVENAFPEPYFWTQLFTPALRSSLRFRVGEWHTTPWKLAIPITWMSSSPVFEFQRLTEWSGKVEIEYRTGNILRVVARPSFQDQRVQRQLDDYLTAWRIIGFSLAPPPEGVELTVYFDFEHEGYTYPSRVELHRFRQIHRDERVTVSRQAIDYTDYRFFESEAEEEIPPFFYQPPSAP